MSEETSTLADQELADQVRHLKSLKDEIEVLETERKKLQAEIVTTMLGTDTEKVRVEIEGDRVLTATVVQPERTVIDEVRLKKKVGPKLWAKVTKQVLDKDKLEAAVQLGDVDIRDVAEVTELVPTTAYVKIATR